MIKRREVSSLVVSSIVCDICDKEFCVGLDEFETQAFHHIDFFGGYESVFGDGSHIQCDICQHCFIKMIGDYYNVVDT